MKIRVLLLSSILALTSLSVSALAQDDQQKTPPSNQTSQQPAVQPSAQQQPATAQQQPATTQQQPASTTSQQPASDQTQAPASASAASAQDQASASDQDSDKDKDKKDKKEKKIKHDGSKNDVDAIGNRKLGGMDWYSTESEIKMGKQYAQQIEQSMKLIQDPVVNE